MPLYLSHFNNQPKFHWDQGRLSQALGAIRHRQGRLLGKMDILGSAGKKRAAGNTHPHYFHLLTEQQLLDWHGGSWRNTTAMGIRAVHASSPDTPVLRAEIRKFLNWLNLDNGADPVLKAAVAHLWFLIIAPFDEGNEAIAHLITDRQLCHADGCAERYYHLSSRMQEDRATYDSLISKARQGTAEITPWLLWFLDEVGHALEAAERDLTDLVKRAWLMDRYSTVPLNYRQQSVIEKLLDFDAATSAEAEISTAARVSTAAGIGGRNDGRISSSQWAAMAGCSQDTALRDIQDLVDRKILIKEQAGGRSTQYLLSTPEA